MLMFRYSILRSCGYLKMIVRDSVKTWLVTVLLRVFMYLYRVKSSIGMNKDINPL
jgi:hypothetical protein